MKRILSTLALPAAFILFAFWILAVKNGYMLRWYDEMSLFNPSAESLRQNLLYPGGVLRIAGTFLTQLLHLPWLGAVALILIWLACAWLAAYAFRLKGSLASLRYLVPFCLLASVVHLDEACLTFESQGYVFYNSLGFTFSLASYAAFIALRPKTYTQASVAIVLPLLYPLFGFFSLLPAAMCIMALCISAAKGNVPRVRYASAALSLLLVLIVPQAYYRFMTGTHVDNDHLYIKGLPELTMNGYDLYLWIPFIAATAILLLYVIVSSLAEPGRPSKSKTAKWCALASFAAGAVCCIGADGGKSEQFRATVLMTQAIEDKNWNKVINIASLTKESPNYTMCVLENLARAYSGMQIRPVGGMTTTAQDPRHDEDFTITAFVNVPVNHHIGRFNQSHRWATENIVQYGDRVYFIKYITLNALMNGNLKLAKRFNSLLKRTMFHRKWAENMDTYINDPSLTMTIPDNDFLMALRAEEMMRGE